MKNRYVLQALVVGLISGFLSHYIWSPVQAATDYSTPKSVQTFSIVDPHGKTVGAFALADGSGMIQTWPASSPYRIVATNDWKLEAAFQLPHAR
jgi:hypothetical protein